MPNARPDNARLDFNQIQQLIEQPRDPVDWNMLPPMFPPMVNRFLHPRAEKNQPGKRGPELFDLILSNLKEVYDVDAIIAGGAVRDYVTGHNEPKDVDVFIPLTKKKFKEKYQETGWGMLIAPPRKAVKDKDGYPTFVESERLQVRVQGVLVDLVFLNKKAITQEDVEHFPIFCQRCVYTLNEGVRISPEAQRDLDAKVFRIDESKVQSEENRQNLTKKIEEWLKRPHYKGWKMHKDKPWWSV